MDGAPQVVERIAEDFMQNPFVLFARLRNERAPREVVMPHGVKVWMVTRYDDVRTLLTDPRVSKDGRRMDEMFLRHSANPVQQDDEPGGSTGFDDDLSAHMMNSDPPRHTRLRKLVSKAFTAHRMESLRPRMEELADDLLDAMADRTEVDLISAYAMPLPITLVFDLLGIPHRDREMFWEWATKLVGAGHDPEEVAEASRQLTEYANSLIDAKREHPDDALVSALVRVTDEDGDRLTQSELVAMIFLLVIAGSETPANQLGNAVYHLLTNPDELAKLRADLSLMPAAVDELMRFDGGVGTASFRFSAADIPLGDVVIPAGEVIVLSLSSANRDSAHFPDADRLDLNRHPVGGLPFGHGIHYCIGAPLARLTMQVGLSRLITRYLDLRLAAPTEHLRWKNSTLVHGLVALPVSLDRLEPAL
jgi:cytochrome P450